MMSLLLSSLLALSAVPLALAQEPETTTELQRSLRWDVRDLGSCVLRYSEQGAVGCAVDEVRGPGRRLPLRYTPLAPSPARPEPRSAAAGPGRGEGPPPPCRPPRGPPRPPPPPPPRPGPAPRPAPPPPDPAPPPPRRRSSPRTRRAALLSAAAAAGFVGARGARAGEFATPEQLRVLERRGDVAKSDDEWARALGRERYAILRREGTERPFSSPLNSEKRAGTFVCAGCGSRLFDSAAKYNSGTGWPSFFQPLPGAVDEVRPARRAGPGAPAGRGPPFAAPPPPDPHRPGPSPPPPAGPGLLDLLHAADRGPVPRVPGPPRARVHRRP